MSAGSGASKDKKFKQKKRDLAAVVDKDGTERPETKEERKPRKDDEKKKKLHCHPPTSQGFAALMRKCCQAAFQNHERLQLLRGQF